MSKESPVISSEDYLIGCLVKDYPFAINLCNTTGFKGDYLDSTTSKSIWSSAESLYARGIHVDAASVIETIEKDHHHIDSSSASALIMKAIHLANDPHKIMFHLKTIREKFKRRHSIKILSEGIEELSSGEEVDNILSKVKHNMATMASGTALTMESDEDVIDRMRERYVTVRNRGTSGIKSRYPLLQQHLASYQYGKLTIIAARPKMGKSTLAVNEAVNTAYAHRIPAGIISIEMDKEELLEKAGSDLSMIDNKKLKLGELSPKQVDDFLDRGVKPIQACPLYIHDEPTMTVEAICSKAREWHAEHGTKLLVIDYLQLISSTPGKRFQSKTYEVAYWTNTLRILAKETGMAVILLSQVTRPPKGMNYNDVKSANPNELPMPTMNDLKDSGAIEQDAYAIVVIGPAQVNNPAPSWHGIEPVCVRVEANRGGSTGDSEMMFDKPHNKFVSFSEYEVNRKAFYAAQNNDD